MRVCIAAIAAVAAIGMAAVEGRSQDLPKQESLQMSGDESQSSYAQPQPAIVRPDDGVPAGAPQGVRVIRDIRYRIAPSANGELELMLDLYIPEGEPEGGPGVAWPVVVWVHGGGWMEGTRNRFGLRWLLRRGYAMASVEYRFSHDAPHPAQIQDVKAAVRWLRAHAAEYGIDANRIGAAGSSAGGHLVALLGTSAGEAEFEDGDNLDQPSYVDAVIDLYGPTDLSVLKETGYTVPAAKAAFEGLIGGTVEEKEEVAKSTSAITHVRGAEPPFLIIHGELDPVVPVAMSRNLHARLKMFGCDSTLVVLPEGGHGEPAEVFWQDQALRDRIVDFLDRNVKHKGPGRRRPLAVDEWDDKPPRMPETTVRVQDIVYRVAPTKHGDVELRIDLYLPPDPRKPSAALPVVLWVHGGGWAQGSKFAVPLGFLTEHGYALASCEYRFTQEAKFPAQIEDVKAAVRWLRAHAMQYNLDGDRVAAAGGSSGGHLAALLGTSAGVAEFEGEGDNLDERSDVAAVLDFFGPADLTVLAETGYPSVHTRVFTELLLDGPIEQRMDAARRASANTYVTADDPPFLILHGLKDPFLPVQMSRRLHEALVAAGVESTLIEFPEGGHGDPRDLFFSGVEAKQRIVDFFDRHLKRPQP